MSEFKVANHYLFMNRQRTNTNTKALNLFIMEEVVIKIVYHPPF